MRLMLTPDEANYESLRLTKTGESEQRQRLLCSSVLFALKVRLTSVKLETKPYISAIIIVVLTRHLSVDFVIFRSK